LDYVLHDQHWRSVGVVIAKGQPRSHRPRRKPPDGAPRGFNDREPMRRGLLLRDSSPAE
jgi:hypothetical protein